MNARDEEYIWNKLANPCEGAMEAYARLKNVTLNDDANQLMDKIQRFTDECREIRKNVTR